MKKQYLFIIMALCTLIFMSSFTGFFLGYKYTQKNNINRLNNSEIARRLPAESNIVADVVDQVLPSVVNIKTSFKTRLQPEIQGFAPFDFDFFFTPKERIKIAGGTGLIIRKDGYILTNRHVVNGAKKIEVNLPENEKTYKAKIVGLDAIGDIAVLKIDTKEELPVMQVGDSSKLRIGEWVIAIGSPLGFEHTVTQGIISAINRKVRDIPASVDFIQTDAAINPGNSGGPLVDLSGKAIGINTAIRTDAQNIGFAIPINKAMDIANQLIKTGKVERPWVGIQMSNIDMDFYGIKNKKGVLVDKVWPSSPASKAGIQQGDIIKKIDAKKISDTLDIQKIVRKHKIGEDVKITVFRNDKELELVIKTEKLPEFNK